MSSDALLKYFVYPSTVATSTSTKKSVVTLQLTVSNPTENVIECRSIAVTIPCGIQSQQLSPVADAGAIVASIGPNTPWAIAPSGFASALAMPLPPSTGGLSPGANIEFILSNIVVNNVAGTVSIEIRETTTINPDGKTIVKVDKRPN